MPGGIKLVINRNLHVVNLVKVLLRFVGKSLQNEGILLRAALQMNIQNFQIELYCCSIAIFPETDSLKISEILPAGHFSSFSKYPHHQPLGKKVLKV